MAAQLSILLALVLWSSLGVLFRYAQVPVHIFLFYSLLTAVALQSLIVWRRGYFRELEGIRDLGAPVLLGLTGLLNSMAFFYAFRTTTISNAVITHYTAPVLVAVLAALFLGERITASLVLSIAASTAGLWIMLDGVSLGGGHAKGIVSGLVSGVAYALIIVIARRHAAHYQPFLLTYLVNLTILVCLAPFVRELPLHAVWAFLIMGLLHSVIAPMLYYRGMQQVSAGRTAVLGYIEPVCAILLGMLFLDETPAPSSLLGGILILGSGIMTLRSGA